MKSSKPALLIVDDNQASAESMKMLFYVAGFPAVTAYSANEARRLMGRFSFDVMLLDYLMDPKLNGLEFLRECRKDGVKTPAIICSGVDACTLEQVKDTVIAELLGPCLIRAKPADPISLMANVEALAATKPVEQS